MPQNITGLAGNIGSGLTRAFATPYQGLNRRLFAKNADGSYSSTNSADNATLRLVGDHYEITEEDGTTVVLRSDGRLNYLQNRNGFRITASYDAVSGFLVSLLASDGQSLTFHYNAQGRIDAITDRANQQTTFTYSANGQLLTGINDASYQVSYSYESPYSQTFITKATYADGTAFVFDYDTNGRIQQQSLLNGDSKITYRYSKDGLSYSVLDGTGATTTVTRTADGGFTLTNPLGKSFSGSYNTNTRTWSYTDPNGAISKETYSVDDRLTETTNALNQKVSFTYDPTFGQLSGFTDAKGNGVDYAYDTKGNLNKVTYEDGSFQQYSYDQTTGLLTQITNRRGQSINLQYNSSYQLTTEQHSNTTVTYGYNAATGQLNSITDNHGTTSIDFNPTTRQSKITYGNGRSLSYTFDISGRRTQLVVQDNTSSRTTNYTYDSAGRLDKLTDGSNLLVVDYDYDALTGRLQKETNGNGTYTTYEYDAAGQLTKLGNYASNGTATSRFLYTYNDVGQRTQVTSLDGTWTYGYDATGQLTRAVFVSTNAAIANQDLTYEYDAAGNRVRTIVNGVTETVTTNNLNQYTQSGNTAYRYDADGNLIEKQTGSQLWKYSYDDQSRLIQVIDAANNTTQYEYDVFGNRSATIYNGTRTEYLIDPSGLGNVVSEYNGSGGLVASYTHGLGLVSRNSNGNSAYYDFDAIGSTASLTSNTGTVLNRYSYRPFGEDFYEVETVSNSFEYVGQFGVTEEQNGLDYMRTRFYDSNIGRFNAVDSIGFQGRDSNFYRYAANNPISFVDPKGTFIDEALLLGAGSMLVAGGVMAGRELASHYGSMPVVVGGAVVAGLGSMIALTNTPLTLAVGVTVQLVGGGIAAGGSFPNNSGTPPISSPNSPSSPSSPSPLQNPYVPGNPNFPGELPQQNPSTPGLPWAWLPSFLLPAYAKPLKNGFPSAERLFSPLVLDLDNDGIELTNLNTSQTYFDVDGDGFREATGWVKADDGLLVRDLNNDNFINDDTELFGNNTAAQINSGFTKLKTLDSNNDGWISATDTAFNSLKIWRDLDQDGISDTGELFTLNQLNISRISVNPTATNQTIEGNKILETAQYELTNGTQRTIVDAWFALDDMDSRYDFRSTHNTPITLTNEILSLPDLRGFGELPNLSIAMAQDPTLLNLVKTFNTKLLNDDFTGATALVENILFRWAKVDGVDPESRLYYVNAQHLGFLEKLMGRTWFTGDSSNPGPNPGNLLENIYTQLKQSLSARLMATYADFEVKFDAASDQLIFNGTSKDAVNRLQQVMSQMVTNSSPALITQKALLESFIAENDPDAKIHKFLSLGDDNCSELLIGYPAIIYGLQGNDTFLEDNIASSVFIDGGEGNDTINGSYWQDTLYGSTGNDLIKINNYYDAVVFNAGDGQDTIQGYYALGTEETSYGTLRFDTGITANDLSWELDTQKQELIISVNGSTDKITLQTCVRELIFNGQVKSLSDFMTAKVFYDNGNRNALSWKASAINFNGDQGNDSIITGRFNDILNGGTGNDTLSSGDGNDTYIFERGGGQDIITEVSYSYYSNDTLVFGTGITKNDLEWSFNGKDLTFVVKPISGSPANTPQDKITIQNFYNSYDSTLLPVSKFIVEGQEITLTEIMTKATISRDDIGANSYNWYGSTYGIKFDGASGNDTIYATNFDDIMNGGDGDDIIHSYDGNDQVFGDAGNDTLTSYWGNDSIDGGIGDDSINGGASDDFLIGGSGNDFVEGEHDTDTLNGGTGNDTLSGGYGADLYLFDRGSGQDIIRELYPEAGEVLQFGTGIVKSDLSWTFNGRDLTFTVKPASGSTAPADTVTIQNFTNGPAI